jgi:putative methyltransferase
MERVKAEIDWFVSHKIEFIFCADANFCLFKRDAEIADYIVSCKEKYGYPKIFRVCFTKNRLDFVFEIGSKFVQHGLEKAQTLSFQSLNDQVLENIGRKNIPISLFRDLMEKYNRQNITTFTELILGLPGETYDSFCQGVCSLLENGQHFAINIYPCELLPNAEMGQLWYREKFNIRSSRIPFRMIHSDVCQKDTGITEYVEFVTSTYSMDSRDWIRSLLFASVIQGLHNLGILRAVAVYCRYECRCDYQRFYQSFVSYAFNETTHFIGKLLLRIQALCNGVLLGQNSFVAPLDGTDHVYWGFDELIFLESYRSASLFFADVKSWLENTFGANEIWDPLLDYQFAIIKKINRSEVIIRSDYDFYTFFTRVFLNAPQPLEKKEIRLRIRDDHPVSSFSQLARETVWYGRNRRETDYTSTHYVVEYSEL